MIVDQKYNINVTILPQRQALGVPELLKSTLNR